MSFLGPNIEDSDSLLSAHQISIQNIFPKPYLLFNSNLNNNDVILTEIQPPFKLNQRM